MQNDPELPDRTVMEEGCWIPTPAGPLAGLYCHPRHPTCSVLLCSSFFEERKGCHRPLVELARRLTAMDAAVLRFDYRGSGDSPGIFEACGIGDWQQHLKAAAAWLVARCPDRPQVWLGVRAGALLALRTASEAGDQGPAGLILWEPVTGSDLLRQLLQRRMVNDMVAYGRARVSRNELETQLRQGTPVDLDGYVVGAQLAAELPTLQPAPFTGPCLLIQTGADNRTVASCQSVCTATTVQSLRLPPFWNTVGHIDTSPLTEATAAWLHPIAANRAGGDGSSAGRVPAHADDAIPGPAQMPVAVAGGGLRLVSFAGALGTVRGVLHIPESDQTRGTVLCLHGWSGDRTGPHGLFVRLAERLAVRGWHCLRIDFGGRGDSDGATGAATIASMTEDARAAGRWLASQPGLGSPVTLLALCSGCKVAIATAAAGESTVARLALWSAESMGSLRVRTTGWRKTRAALAAYLRKLSKRDTWRRLLRRQVQTGMIRKALVGHETRSADEARQEDRTLGDFRRFGGDILFVFGGSDPYAAGSSQAYARFCARHGIRARQHTIAHAGHSYYGDPWKQELLDVTERWIETSA